MDMKIFQDSKIKCLSSYQNFKSCIPTVISQLSEEVNIRDMDLGGLYEAIPYNPWHTLNIEERKTYLDKIIECIKRGEHLDEDASEKYEITNACIKEEEKKIVDS